VRDPTAALARNFSLLDVQAAGHIGRQNWSNGLACTVVASASAAAADAAAAAADAAACVATALAAPSTTSAGSITHIIPLPQTLKSLERSSAVNYFILQGTFWTAFRRRRPARADLAPWLCGE
jgi:hypothetical protein